MEQITRSALITAQTRPLITAHLRAIDAANRAAWAANNLDDFDQAIEQANSPDDVIGAGVSQRAGLVRLESIPSPAGRPYSAKAWALSAKGREFLRTHSDHVPARETPLMGERAHLAAKAA